MNSFTNLFVQTLLLTSSQCTDQNLTHKSSHPRVLADNIGIRMEVRGDHDYYGHVYAGSDYIENRMTFDTMSSWTVLT